MKGFRALCVQVVGVNRNPVLQHNWEKLLQSNCGKKIFMFVEMFYPGCLDFYILKMHNF